MLGRREVAGAGAGAGAGGDAGTTAMESCLLSTALLVSTIDFLAEVTGRGFLGLLEDPLDRVGAEAVSQLKHDLVAADLEVLESPNALLDGFQVLGVNNFATLLDGILVGLKLALECTPVGNHRLEIGTY